MKRPPPRSTLFPYTTLFRSQSRWRSIAQQIARQHVAHRLGQRHADALRSEEHTSELQSHSDLVCRLLLEKKKTTAGRPAGKPPDNASNPGQVYNRPTATSTL